MNCYNKVKKSWEEVLQPKVSLISFWTLNEKAAMSWWPDPEMSCVLCSRQKFCSKVLNCKYQICKQILMNAKISNVNGGDKSLVTKRDQDKNGQHHLVMFGLNFRERRPFSLGLLLLGRCWFSSLAGIFVKRCVAKWPNVTKLLWQVTWLSLF